MIIDTHAHLTWDSFQADLPEVIQRALAHDVKTVINIGADLESSQKAADLNCHPLVYYCTIGLHPHEAITLCTDESIRKNIEKMRKIYEKFPAKVVGVGECGLDYHFSGSEYSPIDIPEEEQKKIQMKLFIAQINLAKNLRLPLVIHSRPSTLQQVQGRTEQSRSAASSGLKDAWDDIFIPELQGTTGVFHSFTGNIDQAKKVLDLGYYLGFTCIITYPKNGHLREIIKNTPLNRILTETDCPFLPPQSMRGQRNEPANVIEVVKIIAEMKNISFAEAVQETSENARKLFKLA